MGVCGCGKSEIGQRLANELAIPFIEGDKYHPPANILKMQAAIPLTDIDRADWLQQLKQQLAAARAKGQGLVLSCSALKRAYRDLLREADPALVFVHLDGDRELITARMRARNDHFMPLSLLDSQLADLQALQADEQSIRLNIQKEPAVLIQEILNLSATR
ncbi:gluconokinase [Undibacterium sp. Jales W-56]|nr:gluconokinase [Undibacterium sp. Jales W-56]MCU6433154.1 gluconokinase [Undibacterium sp. Jales W-56]